jgi:hypothetical protein
MLALAGTTVLVAAAFALAPAPPKPTPAKAAPAATAVTTRVYYFHGNARCTTCRTIEAYAQEVMTSAFAEDLGAKRLEWLVVNVDEPANRHFIDDFQLYARSLVVVDARDPKRYKVLEKVWELVRDKPAFHKYVEQEVRGFGRS